MQQEPKHTPEYQIITWEAFVEEFTPHYHFTFRECFESAQNRRPEIRLYTGDSEGNVCFDSSLIIDENNSFCPVIRGNLVVNGDFEIVNGDTYTFCHITGNLQAENLILAGGSYTNVLGDVSITGGILCSKVIKGTEEYLRSSGSLVVVGNVRSRVFIKNDSFVMLHGTLDTYAFGDYGFCECCISLPKLHYVERIHEMLGDESTLAPAFRGLYDGDRVDGGRTRALFKLEKERIRSLG